MKQVDDVLPPPQQDEHGATAVEYGLMLALIAMVIFGGVYLLGPALDAVFDTVAASL